MTVAKCRKPEPREGSDRTWYGAWCRNCGGWIISVRKRWDSEEVYWRHGPRR